MVATFSTVAAEAVSRLGSLAGEGKFEEADQTHARLLELVGRLLGAMETVSVEQLRGC
jgi:hypothetical protein